MGSRKVVLRIYLQGNSGETERTDSWTWGGGGKGEM